MQNVLTPLQVKLQFTWSVFANSETPLLVAPVALVTKLIAGHMEFTVRHLTPGLGTLPRDLSTDACSGLVGSALGIAQAQAERGHRTQVFGWNPEAESTTWQLGSVEAFATKGWRWAKFGGYDFRVIAPMLTLASRSGRADVLQAYSDPHLLLALGASKRLLHFQTPVPENAPPTYTHLVRRADAVICCGKFIRDQFLERIDYPVERVFSVKNGIDSGRFDSANPLRMRDAWGIDPDTSIVLFTGALVPEKGLLYLLQAANRLQSRFNFEIVVAGSANLWLAPGVEGDSPGNAYLQQLREAAEGLRVRWLGSVPIRDMPDVYAAADICVCPSAWDDPFPLVACEVMAAGKPIIASRRGGLPEIVVDGETGLLIPSHDVTSLGSALKTILSNKSLAAQMGHKAKARSALFTWSNAAAELEAIYKELGVNPERRKSPITESLVR
jgi:glycosyltransferase involved in cell wall biosynthesis